MSKMPKTPQAALEMLGRASFYMAKEYPFIKNDVYVKTPERAATEIILSLKDLILRVAMSKG